jgi:CDP-glycerol glycerophosphotransferase
VSYKEKYLLCKIARFLLRILYVLPIKKNRVMFNSYLGRQYSCNPKAISNYLEKKYPGKFDIVWTFRNPEKFQELKKRGIIVCKTRSIAHYYYKLTSKVSVCNGAWGSEVPDRKGQYDINTWHGGGGGYKRLYGQAKDMDSVKLKWYMLDAGRYSLMLASSETSMKNTVRTSLGHNGDALGGTARNDMLINRDRDDLYESVKVALGLKPDEKLVLYAPTFRENRAADEYDINADRVVAALTRRFGGKWKFAIRLHYYIAEKIKEMNVSVIDASDYPDMQELLYVADCVITDYSSLIWDYSFTYHPCFLYCTDLAYYESKRDFNKPIHTWGFPVCESNDELELAIMNFNVLDFKEKMENHHFENGSYEEGHACSDVCRIIESVCFGDGSVPDGIQIYKE